MGNLLINVHIVTRLFLWKLDLLSILENILERDHTNTMNVESFFYQNANLKRHLMTHIWEKPYQCKLCYKAFSQSSTLINHQKIHCIKKRINVTNASWPSLRIKFLKPTWRDILKRNHINVDSVIRPSNIRLNLISM